MNDEQLLSSVTPLVSLLLSFLFLLGNIFSSLVSWDVLASIQVIVMSCRLRLLYLACNHNTRGREVPECGVIVNWIQLEQP